jgi:hypothetical protein
VFAWLFFDMNWTASKFVSLDIVFCAWSICCENRDVHVMFISFSDLLQFLEQHTDYSFEGSML